MSYIAAIDIGSNAIRLAIAHLTNTGLHISYRSREPVRLGSSVFSTGEISPAIAEDLASALTKFKNQLENHNVKVFRAIATSAMREAKNSQDIVKNLKKRTGIEVEIISGEEEARLVSTAIAQKIDISKGNSLFIDIGGGSIELIAESDGEILKKESFPMGMVRVLEFHKNKSELLTQWLPPFIHTTVKDFFMGLPKLETSVGTGGNMDRFIKLKPHVAIHEGEYLSLHEMTSLHQKLIEVDYNQRMSLFALKPDRADVIVPASITTIELMKMAGSEKIHFPQVGLKDGVLYEMSQNI